VAFWSAVLASVDRDRLDDVLGEVLDGRGLVGTLAEEVGTVLAGLLHGVLGEQVVNAFVHGVNLTGSR